MRGLDVRENAMGLTAVRLHYSADPDKDDAWFDRTRMLFPDPNQWQSEMEISWWIAAGTRVYPEFYEHVHCKPTGETRRKVIYRAWDFGWHAPACIVAQIDEKDRLHVTREIVGNQQTTRSFAQIVIERCAEWYPNHTAGFEDVVDPAGQQAQPAANEKSEVRDNEVLQSLGIFPSWEYGWSRKDGRSLVHQLLRPRTDGTPGLYIDPINCPILLQGFLGKYVFPESKDGKAKDEPDEGQHPWADVQACLRYLCTGLYSALGLRRFRYQPVFDNEPAKYTGYGTPVARRTKRTSAA